MRSLRPLGIATLLARGLRLCWRALRALSGDDAYERYLEHWRERHGEATLPTRAQFYRAEQERRFSGIRRCC